MKNTFIALSIIGLFAAPAMAAKPDWTFVEANYVQIDIDDISNIEPDGFLVNGSYLINEDVFMTASLTRVKESDSGNKLTIEGGTIGAGYRMPLNKYTDAYGVVSIRNTDASLRGSGFRNSNSDTDLGAAIGVRSRVLDNLELDGSVGYQDNVFMDDAGFSGKATYYLTPAFAIGATFAADSDITIFGGNLRLTF